MSKTILPLDALARLARLELAPNERDALARDLAQVMGLLDELKQADVGHVEPLSHPHEPELALREDVVTESDQSDAFLRLAPESQGGFFVVPKVIE